ncbi:oligogalacturonide lyase [Edaphobacter modestus]|uniref:Oligogalacturonide lyase n=2 Tax=Edaphobacter modestus TaxID=388466 RepID=A0A4Q7YW18_9BACT|nr:oligogalacturonide lyase [Edaphobacter modestus]
MRFLMKSGIAGVLLAGCLGAIAQTAMPPKTWVDRDTGHRIFRVTDEPGSSGFYFNVNAYSPDGGIMVYTAPDGIHTMELSSRKTRLLIPNPAAALRVSEQDRMGSGNRAIVVGRKTNSIFFSRMDATTHLQTIFKADLVSGKVTQLATLPARATISTVNADETLGAGVYTETEAGAAQEYGRNSPRSGPLVQPEGKGAMMERRLAARIPVVLFTVDLNTGKVKELLHSTDWIGHLLFSPIDPTLLMYCHEGPWHKVDRIWTIRIDGTQNELRHKRTMLMEIAGHEFWGQDGQTVWYDWQPPKGEDFWLAAFDVSTNKRVAYHLQRDEWSIHFNVNKGATLFCGDGGDPGQVAHSQVGEWINLFHPEWRKNDDSLVEPTFWKPGVFEREKLVNMAHHNYRLEPNVRFSPDSKLIFFTSNMFGPSYVFAVEVAKAQSGASDLQSTPELAAKFAPTPSATPADK